MPWLRVLRLLILQLCMRPFNPDEMLFILCRILCHILCHNLFYLLPGGWRGVKTKQQLFRCFQDTRYVLFLLVKGDAFVQLLLTFSSRFKILQSYTQSFSILNYRKLLPRPPAIFHLEQCWHPHPLNPSSKKGYHPGFLCPVTDKMDLRETAG